MVDVAQRIVKLPSGNTMPTLGLGTVHLTGEDGVRALRTALDLPDSRAD